MQAECGNTECSGPTGTSVFHLHPLQRCNLTCLHCYSHSSPRAPEYIALDTALAAVDMAADWGYQVLSVSGGEPVLYAGLRSLMERAKARNMRISIVTNGMLVNRPGILETLRMADTVCVSVDGLAVSHDQMRGRPGAFSAARRAVRTLADSGLPVWMSCGVTTANLDEIEGVVEEAFNWGAHGVNFHPVEKAGRAQELADPSFLSQLDRLILYSASHLLSHIYDQRLKITVDLLHKDTVIDHPELIYALAETEPEQGTLPANLLGVLVLEVDGTLSPISHGFDRKLSVGSFPFDQSLDASAVWERFLKRQYPALLRAGKSLLTELQNSCESQVLNPSEALLNHAIQME